MMRGLSLRGLAVYRVPERPPHPFSRHSPVRPTLSRRSPKGRAAIAAAFKEVTEEEPAVVASTRRKFGAKRAAAQKTAIALSKARRAGVRIATR